MKHFIKMLTVEGVEMWINAATISAFFFKPEEKLTVVYLANGMTDSAFQFPGNYIDVIRKAIDGLEG